MNPITATEHQIAVPRRALSDCIDWIRESWPMASAATIDRLVRTGLVVEKAPGPVLSDAELPARVGLLVRGTVVATWNAPDGRTVYAGLYGPQQILGLSTLSGGPLTTGIDALTDVTLVVWQSQEFRHIAAADLAMTLNLLDRSLYSVQALNHLIKVRAFASSRSRLAGMLMKYEAFCFSEVALLAPRGQLSALAGVTPRMVNTIIRDWEAEGIVRRVGSTGLELLNRAGLEAQAAPLLVFPPPDATIPGAWAVPTLDRAES